MLGTSPPLPAGLVQLMGKWLDEAGLAPAPACLAGLVQHVDLDLALGPSTSTGLSRSRL